ncbi:RNA-binding protein [Lactobacillus gasseri]|nr:RNA-binding protein [Lactobacillus gasseri]PKZ71846.1 RNA-binding protein [Lactobacillus gasseri]PMB87024.1 RNA-binding protein [Lactobacillus gasseri]
MVFSMPNLGRRNIIMKIKKVINNNIVVINDNNQEAIIMGRGLGFKKKRGDEVDPKKIDKKFYPQTHQNAEQLINMLNDISLDEMEAANEILNLASNKLSMHLNDTEIISLSDHIHNAIARGKE